MVDQFVRVESVVLVATVNALASAKELLSNLTELVNVVIDLNQIVLEESLAGHRCGSWLSHVRAARRTGRQNETRKTDPVGE